MNITSFVKKECELTRYCTFLAVIQATWTFVPTDKGHVSSQTEELSQDSVKSEQTAIQGFPWSWKTEHFDLHVHFSILRSNLVKEASLFLWTWSELTLTGNL